jgi:sulfate adenylyltransferase
VTAATPSLPQFCPPPDVLDDLELMRAGALTVQDGDRLVSVHIPAHFADEITASGGVEIVDPEGVPFARLTGNAEARHDDGCITLPLDPEWTGRPSPRTFERYYVAPAVNAAEVEPGTVSVVVDRPLRTDDLLDLAATTGKRPLQFLVLAGPSHSAHSPAVASIRSALDAVSRLRRGHVVAIPLDPRSPAAKRERVVSAYAPGEVVALTPLPTEPRRHGLVLFFTGLSGSGKSTIARSVRDLILEGGERTVTLLDGDLVRRHLSAGLSFSAADRETNIRRIGWVGAEISRHGGVAICSPIAPFGATRDAVRNMVADAGGDFLLVHVATPLAECERRDRKGLYAKARRGEIPEFTGISSPYEEPTDADLVIDTTGKTIEQAVDAVLALLRTRGHLTKEEILEWSI